MNRGWRLAGVWIASAGLAACVPKGRHDAVVAERDALAAEARSLADARSRAETRASNAQAEIEDARERASEHDAEIDTAEDSLRDALRTAEEYRRLLEERTAQLEAARALAGDAQSDEVRALMARVAELSAIEAETRERAALYSALRERFDALIEAGTLDVRYERGRMVIHLAQDVLFEPGSADLGAAGAETLQELGAVLGALEDQDLQVEGHTDNVPIATRRFPSNWELSSARAMAVVHVLTESGVRPEAISGAGFAEFHPVATNDTPEGRAQNRRIEIVILPDVGSLLDIDALEDSAEDSGEDEAVDSPVPRSM